MVARYEPPFVSGASRSEMHLAEYRAYPSMNAAREARERGEACDVAPGHSAHLSLKAEVTGQKIASNYLVLPERTAKIPGYCPRTQNRS